MTLDEWMTWKGIKNKDFAEDVECHEATISRIRRGLTAPERDLGLRIQAKTEDHVTLQEMYEAVG